MKTWHEWQDAYPPIVVRLCARTKTSGKMVRALSGAEIAIIGSLPLYRVNEISRLFSWGDVPRDEIVAFCRGCGFDPACSFDRERQRDYLNTCQRKHYHRPPFYLTASPSWTTEFLPLIELMRSSRTA